MDKKQKYILITGASSGIGEISAITLAQNGFHVFAGVRKNEDAEKIKSKLSNITPVILDVTSQDSINGAFAEIAETLKEDGLYGLVNNAGIAVAGPLEFLPIDKLRLQLEVNVIGQIAVIQKFLPLLRQCSGRIVNISSISGFIASPFCGAYAASKFALEALSDSLRRELSLWNIPVSLVQPGIIKTPIWEKSINLVEKIIEGLPSEAEKYYGGIYKNLVENTKQKVNEKAAPPEEVAKAVLHALSAKKPKIRYLVGKDAKFVSFLAKCPDSLVDCIICGKIRNNILK